MPRSTPDLLGDTTAAADPDPARADVAGSGEREAFPRALPWLLLLGGLVGAAAAFVLTVEKIALLKDPDYVPSCSINPVLSCGSIMTTEQAEVFGFPNPLIGLVAFPVVVTLGVLLLARVQLPVLVWRGLLAGTALGAVFVHWLIFQSLYRIDALCPYCMAVWAVTVPMFWYTLLRASGNGAVPLPAALQPVRRALLANHAIVLTGWFLLLAGLIAHRFWDYWTTLG